MTPMFARVGSIVILLVGAMWLYGFGLGVQPPQPDELQLQAQSLALAANRGRDDMGRWLPVFVRATDDVWLAPVSLYAGVVMTRLAPGSAADLRWPAVLLGSLNVILVYLLADQILRHKPLAFVAGLLLLLTPAHFAYARVATRDGVWQSPFILVWLTGLVMFLKNPREHPRSALAVGAAALAGSVYSQPSAAVMVPFFLAISMVAVWRTHAWKSREVTVACLAFAAVLAPLALWFAVYPTTYVDTLGRWVLHPAHIRSPVAWMAAASNWLTLTVWSDGFWKFFAPSLLFFSPGAPGFCGVFLLPVAIMIAVGVRETLRGSSEAPGGAAPRDISRILLVGFLVGPLTVATFKEPPAIERALIMVPFGVLLAAVGVDALWERAHAARVLAALLLCAVPFQFSLCYGRFPGTMVHQIFGR